jgi:hypothetical protein
VAGPVASPTPPATLPPPSANILWVAPSGVDDAARGTESAPLRTLAFACGRAQAGQTIRLAAGEYRETAQCVLRSDVRVMGAGRSGTSKSVVFAPQSWDFRADGLTDNAAGYIIRADNVKNVTVDQVELRGNENRANGAVLVTNSNAVTLRELNVVEFRLYGLQFRGASAVDAQSLYIENSSFEWFKNTIAQFPGGGSLGNLGVFDVRDSVFGFTKIKTTTLRGYGIKAANLSRVKFTNFETDLYPYQSWNAEGTPGGGNFSMELHGGYGEEVEISHSLFDATLSLMGGNEARYDTVPYSFHVHHNRFVPKNSAYGIELGTDKMVVDHNYFTGTWTAMQNFGDGSTRIRDLTVFNNVADNVWMRFVGVAGQVDHLRLFGNTIYLGANSGQNYLVTLNANNNSRNWLLANNAVAGSTTNRAASRQFVLSYMEGGSGSTAPRGVQIRNNLTLNINPAVAINDTPVSPLDWDSTSVANAEVDPGLLTSGSQAFQPTSASAVVDRGDANIGVRNGFAGAGRDVGAFELGQAAWQAGPGSVSEVTYLWAPTTTVKQDAFVDTIDVPLSAPPGAQIRYTLDGTEPGPGSTLYTAPIRISQPAKLRARTFANGFGSATALSLDLTQGIRGYPNLSTGASASASSNYPDTAYSPKQAIDGVTFSWQGWAAGLSDAQPWLQLDLGQAARVRHIELFTRAQIGADDPAPRRNFEIRASNDPAFGTYVVLASQGATPLPFQGVFEAAPTNTGAYRYVRAVKTVPEWFFIAELIVRGEVR